MLTTSQPAEMLRGDAKIGCNMVLLGSLQYLGKLRYKIVVSFFRGFQYEGNSPVIKLSKSPFNHFSYKMFNHV